MSQVPDVSSASCQVGFVVIGVQLARDLPFVRPLAHNAERPSPRPTPATAVICVREQYVGTLMVSE